MQFNFVRKRAFLFVAVLLPCLSSGQFDQPNAHESDAVFVQSLLDSAYQFEISDPEFAIQLYTNAVEKARTIDYSLGEGRALQYIGIVLSDQGEYTEAMQYYEDAIRVFNKIPYPVGAGSTYNNIGNIYKRKAEYGRALSNYLSGVRVFEGAKDTARLIYAYGNVGAILFDVAQYQKSMVYNKTALELSIFLKDSVSMCDKLINIGMIKVKQNDVDSAMKVFDRVSEIAHVINDAQSLYLVYDNYSGIAFSQGKALTALGHARQSLGYAKILNNPAYLSNAYTQSGACFLSMEQLDSARQFLDKGRGLAISNQANEVLRRNYNHMALLEEKEGNLREALEWTKRFQLMERKHVGERQNKVIAGLEIEYESDKKDLALSEKALQLEKSQALLSRRKYLITILSVSILALIFILLLVRKTLRQKKEKAEREARVQKEKMAQLKEKQQLIALKAMVHGEEKERSRLSKDIHDGLGGMLSSTKMHLSSLIEDNTVLKNSASYSKALELIDLTSLEARKISHNLMPAALEKYGLIEALDGFCKEIDSTNKLKVSFQTFGMEQRLDSNVEIMVYRIVLELMNNVLKHAEASELIVQCMKNENYVNIEVEDNGKGFDSGSDEKEGIGLSNIRSRVEYLNGDLHIESIKSEGTSVSIAFEL